MFLLLDPTLRLVRPEPVGADVGAEADSGVAADDDPRRAERVCD